MKTFCKTLLLLIYNSTFIIHHSFSQAPGIEWQNTIGGSASDQLSSIKKTFDGGYISGGVSGSSVSGDKTENCLGAIDFWVVKVNAIGNIQWQNTIGGSSFDILSSLDQTTDGGYILGGSSQSNISGDKTEDGIGNGDYWVVKLDGSGNIQWQNTIGGSFSDNLLSIQQTFDGGYILGGYSSSNISGDKTENSVGAFGAYDYWIVKIDSNGIVQWDNTIGGDNFDYLYSVRQTADKGYIIGGTSESDISGDKTENAIGNEDYWIVKLDSAGIIQWQNTIGGLAHDEFRSIIQTSDFGYFVGGYSYSNISGDKSENSMGVSDYWILKLDSSGNIQWQNTIGGNSDDNLTSVDQTIDGGYILGGNSLSGISGDKTENCEGIDDYWIIKVNSSGNIIWQTDIGGNAMDQLSSRSIQQTVDEGYILGGSSNSNISGDKTENCIGSNDYWIVKLLPDTITSTPNLQSSINNFQIFPNPSNSIFQITFPLSSNQKTNYTLEVINTLGQAVYQAPLPASPRWGEESSALSLDLSFLPKGLYVLKINDGVSALSCNFVIQ